MNDQFNNKVITVTGVEILPDKSRIKITGDDGFSYSFFTTLKGTGNPSQAYQDFVRQGVSIGKRIGISFIYQDNDRNPNAPYRTIRAIADPSSVEYNQDDGRQVSTVKPAPYKPKTTNDRETVEGKCRFGFLVEAYRQGERLDSQLVQKINGWVEVALTGEMPQDNITVEDVDTSDIPGGVDINQVPW